MKQRRLIWHLFFVILITGTILYSPFLILNNAAFQKWFINTYRPFPPWKTEFESLKINLIPAFVQIKRLKLIHPSGHQIEVPSLSLRVKLWRLLRGQLVIHPLQVESPTFTIAKTESKPKTAKKPFKLRTLLLTQNLNLEKSSFKNIRFFLPNEKTLEIKKCELSLSPALLGGTKLSLTFNEISFQSGHQKQSTQELKVAVTTNLNHWSKTFPYVDDVEGDIHLKEGKMANFPIQAIEAKVFYKSPELHSKKFELKIKDRLLLGTLSSNLQTQKYSFSLNTPEPISLPEIGSERRTFNMGGDLKIDLKLEGEGFNIKKGSGKGTLKATHLFTSSPEHPVDIAIDTLWENGILSISEGKVVSDEKEISLSGSFDFSPPTFHLKFTTPEFPIERVFDKFADKNLHPIFGKGNVEGSLEGFKKTIHLSLQGKVTEGGYGPLNAEQTEAKLDLTYDQLKIDGSLSHQNKTTGKTNLIIQYGPKIPGEVRPKQIHLDAEIMDAPLNLLIPKLPIEGIARATLKLQGPPKNFLGDGIVSITRASLYGIRMDSLQTSYKLTPKNLSLLNTTLNLENQPTTLKTLNLNFVPGGVDFIGEPTEGLKTRISYRSQNQQWKIEQIDFQDPMNPEKKASLKGNMNPAQLDIQAKGALEASHLQFLTPLLREASGPMTFQISLQGPPKNPQMTGSLNFDKTTLSLRPVSYIFEDLEGLIQFQGRQIKTQNLKGKMNGGSFNLSGSLQHEERQHKFFDLHLQGSQLYYRNAAGKLRVEYDADVFIKGAKENTEISGKVDILDGRYTKDFNIIEELKKTRAAEKEILEAAQEGPPLRLNLKVKNLGDLVIDNNVGRIELAADLQLRGTSFNPIIDGNIEVTSGKLHYLGLDFDITHGFMEFRDTSKNPYLEIEGEQDFDVGDTNTHLTAKLYGRTDNLRIDLAGTSDTLGALERKDVISLLLFGMTTTDRVEQASFQQFQLGPELVGEQIARSLQRPLARATGLDILRLETKPTETGRIRSFHIGKRLSDRLNIEFASEINLDEALQTFRLEYWLTDFFILKGSKEASAEEQNYQLHMGVRFDSR